MVKANKIKSKTGFSYELNVPTDYKMIRYSLGYQLRENFIVFKRCIHLYSILESSIFGINFQPQMTDCYPQNDFPVGVTNFCFPNGIRLSNQMMNPISFSFMLT